MKNVTIITGLLVAGGLSFATAQMSFTDMDRNGDGIVQEQEFYETQAKNMEQRASENKMMKNAANAPKFSDMDLNNDGQVTNQEMNQFRSQKMIENRYKNSNNGNGFKGNGNGGMGKNK